MILAIETSCDETAVALLSHPKSGNLTLIADLISSQMALHAPYGGVVPELASREHLTNLPIVVREALRVAGITVSALSAIAVTRGPGLNGCLLVGLTFAKGLAAALRIPLLAINHLEGHLLSAYLLGEPPPLPTLNLLVSGGHTELVLRTGLRNYEVVARTRDDAAGEAFDKCATLLGLAYPGGPALAALASQGGASRFSFPIGMSQDDSQFSFSGLKTAVRRLVDQSDISDAATCASIAASVQCAIVDALVLKTVAAINRVRPQGLFLTGGVAANSMLRERLSEVAAETGLWFRFPPHRWCTDNAAMIGVVAYKMLEENPQLIFSHEMLNIDSRPRYPIGEL